MHVLDHGILGIYKIVENTIYKNNKPQK